MSLIKEMSERMAEKREALRTVANKQPAPETNRDRAKLIPMAERIEKVLAAIPPEELEAGIRIEALCERLAGKYRGHAQAGEVGAGLRKLGYVRVRCWRGDDTGFRSLWKKEDK